MLKKIKDTSGENVKLYLNYCQFTIKLKCVNFEPIEWFKCNNSIRNFFEDM